MDDPFSRPGPERSFPCPRSAVCIIVTNASRPDHPARIRSIPLCGDVDAADIRMPLHRFGWHDPAE